MKLILFFLFYIVIQSRDDRNFIRTPDTVIPGCETLQSGGQTCAECKDNYLQISNTECDYDDGYDFINEKCKNGYKEIESEGESTEICEIYQNCETTTIQSTETICSKCKKNYFKKDNKCLTCYKCKEDKCKDNEGCSECEEGYFLSKGFCYNSPYCEEFDSENGICKKCKENRSLQEGVCIGFIDYEKELDDDDDSKNSDDSSDNKNNDKNNDNKSYSNSIFILSILIIISIIF